MKEELSNVFSSDHPCFDLDVLYQLRKAAHTNLVVFLGAGISMDVNLPSWRDLLTQLACSIDDSLNEKLQSFLDAYQYDFFLEELIVNHGLSEDELKVLVSKLFHVILRKITSDEDSIYSHLTRFPLDRIITTNYDNLCARFMDIPVYSPSEWWRTIKFAI